LEAEAAGGAPFALPTDPETVLGLRAARWASRSLLAMRRKLWVWLAGEADLDLLEGRGQHGYKQRGTT